MFLSMKEQWVLGGSYRMQPQRLWQYLLGNELEMQKKENSLKYVGHFILYFLGLYSNVSTSQKLRDMGVVYSL